MFDGLDCFFGCVASGKITSGMNSSAGKTSADPRYVKDFLAQLVVKHNVAAGTQNQSFYSLLFFFRFILKRDIGDMKEALRAQH